MPSIYLDYNASTPIDPAVAEAMRPYLDTAYGNPSSDHASGHAAREAVERARGQIAELLGCDPSEVVFTSGGSEANNFAIKGVWFARREPGAHFVSSAVEHPSVLNPLRFVESQGAEVTLVPVDRFGRVDPADVERSIKPQTVLVSIMHANNEVGTIEPIREIAQITRRHKVLLHVDAAQSVGKVETKVDDLGVDLLTVAGHKLYAPKGVGVLYMRRGVKLEPLIHGAGHEGGRRAGTESALLAVGLGQACALARRHLAKPEAPGGPLSAARLRDRLEARLRSLLGDRIIGNGHPEHRLPNTSNLSFVGRGGPDVLTQLQGVAASTGSACHAGSVELSPVLKAMGISPEIGLGAVRFSLGRWTTEAEIDEVVKRLTETLS